jgi:nucleoside-diphosphate-sugar epimerase
MRIFLAGAAGAIGRRLVPLLVAAGHQVTGLTRNPHKAEEIWKAGAKPVIADALDAQAVMSAVEQARPEVVVHQLTAIPAKLDLRRIDRDFALTNRLRTEGLDNLIAAAKAAGCGRVIAQSYAGWPFAREGGAVKSETDGLDPHPPARLRAMLEAIRYTERTATATQGIEGAALRYGPFYGPGNTLGAGGAFLEDIRKRRVPVIGDGAGVWSFVQIDDAASATVCAIERAATGIFNICDDEPAPVSEWLPALAAAIGAPRPMRVPAWIARLLVGDHGVAMMTSIRGASNAKARSQLGWRPRWTTWREGFRQALS